MRPEKNPKDRKTTTTRGDRREEIFFIAGDWTENTTSNRVNTRQRRSHGPIVILVVFENTRLQLI